jgi:hypothetical protein
MKKLSFITFLFFITSCAKTDLCDCFKSTGEVVTEVRNIANFKQVYLQDNVNLYILQDSLCFLTVRAGKNLLGSVKTTVRDGLLTITNENSCNWVRDLNNQVDVFISLPVFELLTYKGYGNVNTLNTICSDNFGIDIHDGSGSIKMTLNNLTTWIDAQEGVVDFTLNGWSESIYVYNNGLGPVDCRNLGSDFTFVTNSSTNDCFVNARKKLDVRIEYLGNIYYSGNPDSISSKITGEGRLIRLE